MLPAGFETTNSASERSQTYAVERSANGICIELSVHKHFILRRNQQTYVVVQHSIFDCTKLQTDTIFVKEFLMLLNITPLFPD
jgi:hypothetical protein